MSGIEGADQDPPETATPELEDEPTEVEDDWSPVEVLVDVEVLAVAPDVVAAVPGIV